MTTYAVAPSVEELLGPRARREPMTSADSKSGARFERVTIDGERFVLKHVDRRDDWIMRQTGDLGCVPVLVWESGVLDLVPDVVDHTTVGAARTPGGGAVLMRDVRDALVPPGDAPLPLDRHLRFLDHLATFHAATLGWRDTIGLIPLANRYSFFSPVALACEAELGASTVVPRLAREGWARLPDAAPALAHRLTPLQAEPWPLFEALDVLPQAFVHGDWKLGNVGSHPDGRTVLVDWSVCGQAPPLAELLHYLALNAARLPAGHDKDDTVAAYRAALARHGVDATAWFDEQLALCTVGVMLQLGWEKALGTPTELAWWEARALGAFDATGL